MRCQPPYWSACSRLAAAGTDAVRAAPPERAVRVGRLIICMKARRTTLGMLGHERKLLEQYLSRELAGVGSRIVLWGHLDHVGAGNAQTSQAP